ncbi:5-carboxymethyl-2-hydroxymuconate Delta-isomerase [Marivirga sp.]|uniref:5-carboxymethyl-2-hydroxymuconate Delta-isomerase n=1 Tax=Marivirga sp. TaxID=2018662 RepID=UPI00345CBA18
MPHLILECSDKIASNINFNSLFIHLHQYLADNLPTQITSCKSRVRIYDNYFIGDEFEKNLFMHLTLKILPGRSAKIKNRICEYIHHHLKGLVMNNDLEKTSISIELLELSAFYFK